MLLDTDQILVNTSEYYWILTKYWWILLDTIEYSPIPVHNSDLCPTLVDTSWYYWILANILDNSKYSRVAVDTVELLVCTNGQMVHTSEQQQDTNIPGAYTYTSQSTI